MASVVQTVKQVMKLAPNRYLSGCSPLYRTRQMSLRKYMRTSDSCAQSSTNQIIRQVSHPNVSVKVRTQAPSCAEDEKLATLQSACDATLKNHVVITSPVHTLISDVIERLWPDRPTSSHLVAMKLQALHSWGLDDRLVLRHSALLTLDYNEITNHGHLHYFQLVSKTPQSYDLLKLLAARLEVDIETLEKRVAKFPSNWSRALLKFEDYMRKISTLRTVFTTQEIASSNRVLLMDLSRLNNRLQVLNNHRMKITWLCESESKFNCYLSKLESRKASLVERFDPIRIREIAYRIGQFKKLALIGPKIQILLANGFSDCDIIDKPGMLSAGFVGLCDRLNLLREKRISVDVIKRQPKVLTMSTNKLSSALSGLQERATHLALCSRYTKRDDVNERCEQIARMFGITNREAEQLFPHIRLKTLAEKVDLLGRVGISKPELVIHPRIARLGLSKLRNLVRMLDVGDVERNMRHVCASTTESAIPVLAFKRKYIANLLVCSKGELSEVWTHLNSDLTFHDCQLREAVELLISSGFLIETIRECPLILNYTPEVINQYLSRPELSEFSEDQSKRINTLCYLLETDVIPYDSSHVIDEEYSSNIVSLRRDRFEFDDVLTEYEFGDQVAL